ncbi:MAG: penicillin-binding protein 2 [Flavobacteriaceae bacterium]|nr:penicillin-binding protein 2 [Flavobacteriaceae bacterium]
MRRGLLLFYFIIIVGAIFIFRLFYIQIIDDEYRISPLNNSAVRVNYDYPERGYVFDRNGVLLAANQPSYDIMVIPREIKDLDTLELCNLIKIDISEFVKKIEKSKIYSPYLPSVFLSQITKDEYAYIQEKMYKFKGFYIQSRSQREYMVNSAANVLGYISEVNDDLIQKNPYYQSGELIGAQGIEKQYEEILRGKKGMKFIQKDRFNREIGSYREGTFDSLPEPGSDITLTIDIALQQYGEKLMQNKRGGIVAIDPKTGEILTLISMPTYNPNLMVGKERSKNSVKLFGDKFNMPMYDRSLQAQYPPGSPFKIVNALVGLQEGVITPETSFYCYHGYQYGSSSKAFMACHCGVVNYPIKLNMAIYKSCNAYFANVYKRTIDKYKSPSKGIDAWSAHMHSFGLGDFLGYDLPIGRRGHIPNSEYYNKNYKNGNWRSTATISNAIGQGEVLTTPIQLANLTATIANKGYYYTPHILKKITDKPFTDFNQKKVTTIDTKHFEPIIDGMFQVFEIGTARYSRIETIQMCGKTGTAENFKRINGRKVQFEDHSIFIAFAPKDNPKIAIAIFVENGGFGATIAAPIASLMIEKYLTGEVLRTAMEQGMIDKSLEYQYQKQLFSLTSFEKTTK